MKCKERMCSDPVFARGWCNAHYLRWRRHGDPTGGSTPRGRREGSPARYFKEVVENYTGDECLLWPFSKNAKGYAQMRMNGSMRVVGVVICEKLQGPRPSPQHDAAHSCGKGHLGCVALKHLRWMTHAENIAEKDVHGTTARGERAYQHILTEADVRTIRSLAGKVTQSEMAKRFSVSQTAISNVITRKNWSWLP